MVTSRGKVLVAVAGSVLAVTGIAVASFALHGTPPRDAAASQHETTSRPALAPPASQGATPAAAADTPATAAAQNHAPATPAQSPAATPATTPAATQPPAPDPLTACTTPGDTTTDAAGHQVQCAGNGTAPMWMCYTGPYPGPYPAVPGQTGPPGGWPVVLDIDGTAYVADNPLGGPGAGVWQWQVTAPPC